MRGLFKRKMASTCLSGTGGFYSDGITMCVHADRTHPSLPGLGVGLYIYILLFD